MSREQRVATAADIMRQKVFTLTPEQTIDDAVTELANRGFSGAPVVDPRGKLVGVLTEKDCIQILASAAFHALPTGIVSDAMHREVLSVQPETDLFRLTYLFHENPYRRIPVVSPGGILVGIIARRDMIRALDAVRRLRGQEHRKSTYDVIREHLAHQS